MWLKLCVTLILLSCLLIESCLSFSSFQVYQKCISFFFVIKSGSTQKVQNNKKRKRNYQRKNILQSRKKEEKKVGKLLSILATQYLGRYFWTVPVLLWVYINIYVCALYIIYTSYTYTCTRKRFPRKICFLIYTNVERASSPYAIRGTTLGHAVFLALQRLRRPRIWTLVATVVVAVVAQLVIFSLVRSSVVVDTT